MTQLTQGQTTKYRIKPGDYSFRSTATGYIVITNNQNGKEESFLISDLRALRHNNLAPGYMRELARAALASIGES